MDNQNVKVAKELVKLAKQLIADNEVTKEDAAKAWKTRSYLWKQFLEKHKDEVTRIIKKHGKSEVYNVLFDFNNMPMKITFNCLGDCQVQGRGEEKKCYDLSEALEEVERYLK